MSKPNVGDRITLLQDYNAAPEPFMSGVGGKVVPDNDYTDLFREPGTEFTVDFDNETEGDLYYLNVADEGIVWALETKEDA